MAKLNKPLHSLRAHGRLTGQAVIRTVGRVAVFHKKPHPTDPRTPAQLAWRAMYQMAIDLWHQLSPGEQAAWNVAARYKTMTGYAYFISCALKPNPGVYLPFSGGTMTGAIDMDSNRVLNLPAPADPAEPARLGDLAAYAPLAAFQTHAARHGFLAADQLQLRDLLSLFITHTVDWQTIDRWTEDHTGTASFVPALMNSYITTGATNGSRGRIYTARFGAAYHHHGGQDCAAYWSTDSYVWGLSNSLVWLGYFLNDAPADTDRHVGWKIIDGIIHCTNANGAAQTITNTGSSMTAAYAERRLRYIATSTSIQFYINETLVATHTTNLPGAGQLRHVIQVTNTIAANRALRIYFHTLNMRHP